MRVDGSMTVNEAALALSQADPVVADLAARERRRQEATLDLIASENSAPQAVLAAVGSAFNNKTAEGYPGRRYHTGCEVADELEALAVARAKTLFGAEHANVQPHSGVNANLAVYAAMLAPGDRVLSMKLSHGGHLSHGDPASITGRIYRFEHYGVDPANEVLDYDQIRDLALQHRPRMIIAGGSSYPRLIEYATLRRIADEVGAFLLVDMAHIAGLVAAGVIPSPTPHADFITFTTYKTMMGPHGGVILCRAGYARKIDRAVFPGVQGTPTLALVAGKAVCFGLAATPAFAAVQRATLVNARVLCDELADRGLRPVSGGTDTHLLLLDLRGIGLKGNVAEQALAEVGILANRNVIPYDPEAVTVTSGLRLGTPGVTGRGMGEAEMRAIAGLIGRVLAAPDDRAVKADVRESVVELCRRFPLAAHGL